MLADGAPPLWTPHALAGYPLLLMAQLGAGYPVTWGHAFLPARRAERVYVLAPCLLAPAFTYLYCRRANRSPLAGLSFGYGGVMFSKYTANGMTANALTWLSAPGASHFFDRTSLGLRPRLFHCRPSGALSRSKP